MSRNVQRKKKKQSKRQQLQPAQRRGKRYSAGEIFLAVLGALLLIMIGGMIVTSLLGD